MDATLQGTLVFGFGRTLARALVLVLLGVPLISVAPVLLEARGYLTGTMTTVVFVTGIGLLLLLVLNEIWTRGAMKVNADGVLARTHRLLQWSPRTDGWAWAEVESYRFDTDPQGRPYVCIVPRGAPDVSCYGRAGENGLADFGAFEATFRALAAQARATLGADGLAEAAALKEAPSFYTKRWVRVASTGAFVLALALTVFLFVSGSEAALRSLWLLLVATGVAARVWAAAV